MKTSRPSFVEEAYESSKSSTATPFYCGSLFGPFTAPMSDSPISPITTPYTLLVDDMRSHIGKQDACVREMKARIERLESDLAASQAALRKAEVDKRTKSSENRQLRDKAAYLQGRNTNLMEANQMLWNAAQWYYADFVCCFQTLQLLQSLIKQQRM